jgi:hypothetical protein
VPIEREKIRSALLGKGFIEVTKKRDHDFYYLAIDGRKQTVFTKLSRGSSYREYSDNLVADVYKQICLTKPEFLEYIECSLELIDYLQLLKERNIIK